MEQVESVSMSSVIATMLLRNRVVTHSEVAILCSKLSLMEEVYVDEDNDCNMDFLLSFVDIEDVIEIKAGFSYDSLINGVSIFDVLTNLSDVRVNNIISNEAISIYDNVVIDNKVAVKKLRKKPMFGRFSFGMF